MKYLNKFNTKSDYQQSASTLEIPNVAYITATTEVIYNATAPAPGQYVQFADPVVSGVCVSNWSSDGTGCTEADLGAVTAMSSSVWSAATTMTTFDEFQYFTGLTSIAGKTFTNKKSLTSVVIPSGVTSIGEQAFYSCKALTSVTIGNSVVTINDKVFYNCSGLTSVTIPASVTWIGKECFRGCSSLSDITFEATTPPSSIGQWAFYGIASTGNITVPSGSESNYYKLAQNIGAGWTVNNQSPA